MTVPPDLTFVAVVNRTMAQTFWPNQDPIGKVFHSSGTLVRIIGVVGDVKAGDIRRKTMPEAYYPLTAALDSPGFGSLVSLKTSVAPMSVLGAVQGELRGLDSSLAVFRARTMEDVIADATQDTSLQTFLLGIFAGLGLLLAAVGTYSVMAYLVSQRTHEIGIRVALGAQRNDVLRLVLGQGARLALQGVTIGVIAALILSKLLESLLFGVSARDPLTFAGGAFLLTFVALIACYIPARRAMRVDPIVALRYE